MDVVTDYIYTRHPGGFNSKKPKLEKILPFLIDFQKIIRATDLIMNVILTPF